MADLSSVRIEYAAGSLDEATVPANPLLLFEQWYNEAQGAGLREPNAMALATASPDGQPSCRMVLLKGFDEQGFCFYTNYLSRKGEEIRANPKAALAIYWDVLERQVRIAGAVERLTAAESDAYFSTRPPKSRLGAAVSPQSTPIPARDWLEKRMADLAAKHPDGGIPRPENWGGYRVRPERIEFWQGRRDRLHDRILYTARPGGWTITRLAP
jgi:pyridoxamine 5'-phosphate oxidase